MFSGWAPATVLGTGHQLRGGGGGHNIRGGGQVRFYPCKKRGAEKVSTKLKGGGGRQSGFNGGA